jgi:type II secretory pathway pseudopilin PulG
MTVSRLAMIVIAGAMTLSCGPKPEARYRAAIDKKLEGDAHAYYSELIALAHEEPDTRAGRRARVTLQSGGYGELGVLGLVAAVAIANFAGFSARAQQAEAGRLLRGLASFEAHYFAKHQRYSTELPDAESQALAPRTYQVFLAASGPVLVPPGEPSPVAAAELTDALARFGIVPGVTASGFVAAAVANLDGDPDLDIWVIDESKNLVHFFNDLE